MPSPFSFKGTNPLGDPRNQRDRWADRLKNTKQKIDHLSDSNPRQAIALHEKYNELLGLISDDETLRSPSQKGSTVKPTIAPKWLRDEIVLLEQRAERAINNDFQ